LVDEDVISITLATDIFPPPRRRIGSGPWEDYRASG